MATATIEVLKTNPTTVRIKAKKHELVLNGQMMVEGDSVDLDLTIGDAFPPNYVPIFMQNQFFCDSFGDKAVTNLLIGIGAVVGGVLVVVDDRVVWVDKSAE
ncbi:hypothetical protein V1522DRAFT_419248 [Lipomyces starkeyi]